MHLTDNGLLHNKQLTLLFYIMMILIRLLRF